MKQKISTQICLDTRIPRKDNTCVVKLRITHKRQQKYYALGYNFLPEEWDKIQSPKPRGKYKEYKTIFNEVENKAIRLIENIDHFSFDKFIKEFNEEPEDSLDLTEHLLSYIEYLEKHDRLNTADSYRCTLSSISKFNAIRSKNKALHFEDVTPEWLEEYEKWMKKNGKSVNTIGIYLRSLRKIFNSAIENKLISSACYPFGKNLFVIPKATNVKKALTINQIKEIFDYKTKSKAEKKARDLFLFSYLCNGINMKDILKLQYKNLGRDSITFNRSKTERSSKSNSKPITIGLIPEINKIIKRYGVKRTNPSSYIFGYLNGKESSSEEIDIIRQVTKTTNLHLKRIGEKLDFDLKLTTYVARHSFATVLKRSGVSTEFISESLGHQNLSTTENYLDSFENETRIKHQSLLVNF
ncbi:site-specific integrase [Jiulongibacter sediminis]|uniref:tyrosine-type recombinase/integrase n=1 Tax=Jiulongibacter sediminis TaxID=1605367 RepID=UPI0026F0103A|nr:site-specific integrase [Jiulongibacter sediminis]